MGAGAKLATSGILNSAVARTAHVAQELDSSAESGSHIHAIQRKEAAKADVKDKAHASVPDSDLDFLRDHIRKIQERLHDANGMHKEQLEEELRRAQEVIEKVKLLDKVKAQALIEEEKQRQALMQQVVASHIWATRVRILAQLTLQGLMRVALGQVHWREPAVSPKGG